MVGSVGGLKNPEMLTDAYGGTNGWVGLKHLNTYSCVECRFVPLQYESWTNEKFFYDCRRYLLLNNPKVEVMRAFINDKNMLMGVHYIKLLCISRMWLEGEWRSLIYLYCLRMPTDSGWVGIKCAIAYGCLR